jgi:ABC-type lipoprotein export system ATPase subunit
MNKEVLKLQNLCKKYKQGNSVVEVLIDVNLTVTQGELVARLA